MASTKIVLQSFAGGELSQDMYARTDDKKYQSGASVMKNLIATPQGPVYNRPGFEFVRAAKYAGYKTRLIPFTYSTDQTMVLEFGDQYIRFHTNGGTLTGTLSTVTTNGDFTTDISSWTATSDPAPASAQLISNNDFSGGTTGWTLITDTNACSIAYQPGSMVRIASVNYGNGGGQCYQYLSRPPQREVAYTVTVKLSSASSSFDGIVEVAGKSHMLNGNTTSLQTFTGTAAITSNRVSVSFWKKTPDSTGYVDIDYIILDAVGSYSVAAYKSSGRAELYGAATRPEASIKQTVSVTSGSVVTVKIKADSFDDYYGLQPIYVDVGTTSGGSEISRVRVNTTDVIEYSFTASTTSVYITARTEDSYNNYATSVVFDYIIVEQISNPTSPTEVSTPYLQQHLQDIKYVQSADVLTLVHPLYAPRELRRLSASSWQLSTIDFTAPIAAPTGVTATPSGVTGATSTDYYTITSIHEDGFRQSAASSAASAVNNLLATGAYNTISWNAVTGASRYYVYKQQGGLYGYIGSTPSGTLSIVDDNIAPNMSKTPPIYEAEFASAGNYPGTVSYFEQRRCFAGTVNDPQKIWMTRSGTESDLSYSFPVRSDDRIEFRVAAREANTIRHIIPLTQLLLLTASSEWIVKSIDSDAITPTSISVVPQAYVGASNVAPAIVGNAIVYVSDRGNHVRQLGYSLEAGGFVSSDLSLRAQHLFTDGSIVDAAVSKTPYTIVWFVSTTGMLIGFTFIPEQEVFAWHRHVTDGAFESVCCVAEGDEDHLYALVRRQVNGATVRYVERMHTRKFSDVEDCFFVDSGLVYDGTVTNGHSVTVTSSGTEYDPTETITVTASASVFAYPATTDVGDCVVLVASDGTKYRITIRGVTSATVVTGTVDYQIPSALRNTATTSWEWARDSVSGLSHLYNATVSVLADGAAIGQVALQGDVLSLDRPATKVVIGLPYTSELTTMPIDVSIKDIGKMSVGNIRSVNVRLIDSSGVKIGRDVNNLTEYKQRKTEWAGSVPDLINDEVKIVVTPSWGISPKVTIVQDKPLPISVAGMAIEVAVGV